MYMTSYTEMYLKLFTGATFCYWSNTIYRAKMDLEYGIYGIFPKSCICRGLAIPLVYLCFKSLHCHILRVVSPRDSLFLQLYFHSSPKNAYPPAFNFSYSPFSHYLHSFLMPQCNNQTMPIDMSFSAMFINAIDKAILFVLKSQTKLYFQKISNP
jgi:hypothetical protein